MDALLKILWGRSTTLYEARFALKGTLGWTLQGFSEIGTPSEDPAEENSSANIQQPHHCDNDSDDSNATLCGCW